LRKTVRTALLRHEAKAIMAMPVLEIWDEYDKRLGQTLTGVCIAGPDSAAKN
jgi:hypothetical protein